MTARIGSPDNAKGGIVLECPTKGRAARVTVLAWIGDRTVATHFYATEIANLIGATIPPLAYKKKERARVGEEIPT